MIQTVSELRREHSGQKKQQSLQSLESFQGGSYDGELT